MKGLVTAQIEILREDDIVSARNAGKELAKQLGFRQLDATQIATSISELARNIILYAETGEVIIRAVQRDDGAAGLEIVARDQGPGIRDIDMAMRDGYTSSQGLGLGLPGTRRLMDQFKIESEPGRGTTVVVTKWLTR